MAHLQGRERAAFVRGMFDRIARRYDLMNRLMTFGRDKAWRRYAVQQAAVPANGRLLDIATGTGDIAFEALRQSGGQVQVIGADFATQMMRVGQQRPGGQWVLWCSADTLALPCADATFDAVTSGYLLRNVIDVEGALKEQIRVLKAGGRLVALDTTPPPPGLLRPFILLYLRSVIPLLGKLIAGDTAAYTYLPESTQAFKTAEELASIMRDVGLREVRFRRFMFGTMAVHVGIKSRDSV